MSKYYDIRKLKDSNVKLYYFIPQRRNNEIFYIKRRNKMTRQDKINYIIDYFNEQFKWQKLVNDWQIDRSKVESLSDEELDNFITNHCK